MDQTKSIKEAETKALNVWQYLNNAGTGGNADLNSVASDWQLMASYVNNDVVFTCAEMNATQVASTPFSLYRVARKGTGVTKGIKGRKVKPKTLKKLRKAIADDAEIIEVTEHPILKVLTETNEDLNGFQIWKATQLNLEVFGRAYWLIERNPVTDVPESIKVLKTYYVQPLRDPEGIVTGYTYTNVISNTNKETVTLPKEDVIDFRNVSVSDLYAGGTSWLRAAFGKVALSNKFTEFQNWLLDNRARPDALIIPATDTIDPEATKRLQKNFEDRAGKTNNGKPIVLQEAVKYIPLNFQPTDLAPLQFNQEMIKAVANASGVPYALLTNDNNYANMEASLTLWAKRAVLPRVMLLEQVINDSLVPLFGDDTLFIEFCNPVPEDAKHELEETKVDLEKAQIGVSAGALTTNEVRQLLGFEAVDGGDDLAGPPVPPEPTPGAPESGDDAQAEPEGEDAPAATPDAGKAIDVDALLKLNAAVAAGQLDRATAINLAARAFDLEQTEAKHLVTHPVTPRKACGCGQCAATVKAKAGKLPPPVVPDHAKLTEVVRDALATQQAEYLDQIGGTSKAFATVTKADDGLPEKFVPIDQWDEELAHASKPVVELIAQETANGQIRHYTRIGASPDVFSVVPAKVEEAADKASLNFASSTNASTSKQLNAALDQLREQLKAGLLDGDPIRELRNRVLTVFEGLDRDHAELIAQTETMRAVHEGLRIAAKESGVVKGFKFLLSDDACPLCKKFDGKTIGLDEKFNTEDDYDDSMLPVHPGCRCTVTEVLKEVGEE